MTFHKQENRDEFGRIVSRQRNTLFGDVYSRKNNFQDDLGPI